MTDLKQRYYKYVRHAEIDLANDKIEKEDIMTWEQYQDGYIDNLEEERSDERLFSKY